MNITTSRWYRVIEKRRSRRRFEKKPLKANHLDHLKSICNDFRPFDNARALLVTESPDKVFKGAIGPYGKIRGASAFIAFIGNIKSPWVQEQVGYTGEGIVLEAEALNLNTCWVGGFFRPKVVKSLISIGEDEIVIAVTPVGYATKRLSFEEKLMTGFGLTHRRKALSDLVIGLKDSEWPQWIRKALEAARIAPSAVNRQPWRFHVEQESITIATNSNSLKREPTMSKRLCCGTAMLHIETAAQNYGIKGNWKFLDPPLVAQFRIDKK
ncbi:nitroreductase family protein [Chloroflexota bacterium]